MPIYYKQVQIEPDTLEVRLMLIKKYRKRNGWTQFQVAEMLNVTERFYRSIEAGDRRPSYENLNKLEDLFKLPQRILLAKSIDEVPYFYHPLLKQY